VVDTNTVYSFINHDFMNVSDNFTLHKVDEALKSFHEVDIKALVAGGRRLQVWIHGICLIIYLFHGSFVSLCQCCCLLQ
jgi:hypothetical protein